jgi:hypothetical protein|tara:strand:+ start:367 stop:504 length:138 start_codon:yes stop_codon:yes gene_type:complete
LGAAFLLEELRCAFIERYQLSILNYPLALNLAQSDPLKGQMIDNR